MQKVISRIVDKLKKLDKKLAFINYRNDTIKNNAGFRVEEGLVMKDLPEYIHFITKYFYYLKPQKFTSQLCFKLYLIYDIPFETIEQYY